MNNLFLSSYELKLCRDFIDNGFLVMDVESENSLNNIRSTLQSLLKLEINKNQTIAESDWLNQYHKLNTKKNLNETRLNILNSFNSKKTSNIELYTVVKNTVTSLVGNELAMQKNINLSIQLPKDRSSLLDIHGDTWGGNSAFELAVWLPLVDCHDTKSMYILPKTEYGKFENKLLSITNPDSEMIYQICKKEVIFMEIKYGQVLLFNPMLPHGNLVNNEIETRWSLNYRFKNLFTPYGDKKIGEYFDPIIIRPCTQNGLDYKHPNL
jgi:sporadic carbohydrate cluster 2OG-Fe(II) oxygenase